jgi:hypothetical protein
VPGSTVPKLDVVVTAWLFVHVLVFEVSVPDAKTPINPPTLLEAATPAPVMVFDDTCVVVSCVKAVIVPPVIEPITPPVTADPKIEPELLSVARPEVGPIVPLVTEPNTPPVLAATFVPPVTFPVFVREPLTNDPLSNPIMPPTLAAAVELGVLIVPEFVSVPVSVRFVLPKTPMIPPAPVAPALVPETLPVLVKLTL